MTELSLNELAPEFQALSDEGEMVKLSDFRGQKVLLYFYPKDSTSGWTTQANELRDSYSNFQEQNVTIIGLSPDGVESHQNFKAENELPFTLLVDEESVIAKQYGAWGEKSMYGKKYMGLLRSQFLIDEEGKLINIHYKVSPKKSVPSALKALKSLWEFFCTQVRVGLARLVQAQPQRYAVQN